MATSVTIPKGRILDGLTVYGSSVQDGTPTPDAPVHINAVRAPNLITKSPTVNNNVISKTVFDGYECYKYESSAGSTSWNTGSASVTNLMANTTYVYSAWIYWTGTAKPFNFTSFGHFTVLNNASSASDKSHEDVVSARRYSPSTIQPNTWVRISIEFTTNNLSGSTFYVWPRHAIAANEGTLYFRDMQLAYGSTATTYAPAGEIPIVSSDGQVAYLDMTDPDTGEAVELHGLDSTYRDVLHIEASGHAWVEKRCGKISVDDIDQVGTAATGIYYFAKNSLRIAPEKNGTTPTRAKSNMMAANQWSGSWYTNKIFVNPAVPKPQFTHSNADATTLAAVKTVFAEFECVYPLQESAWYTIDLGYVDIADMREDCTLSSVAEVVPELELATAEIAPGGVAPCLTSWTSPASRETSPTTATGRGRARRSRSRARRTPTGLIFRSEAGTCAIPPRRCTWACRCACATARRASARTSNPGSRKGTRQTGRQRLASLYRAWATGGTAWTARSQYRPARPPAASASVSTARACRRWTGPTPPCQRGRSAW